MFLQGIILPMTKSDQQHITHNKKFVPYGTHSCLRRDFGSRQIFASQKLFLSAARYIHKF